MLGKLINVPIGTQAVPFIRGAVVRTKYSLNSGSSFLSGFGPVPKLRGSDLREPAKAPDNASWTGCIIWGLSLQVTISDSQNGQSRYLDAAEREPVSILSGGVRRAVVVSPEFFDRAIEVLEDLEDIRTAAAAQLDGDEVPLDELKAEFGL